MDSLAATKNTISNTTTMSLNFVSKSIQTSTSDGTYEETPVNQDSQTEMAVNTSGVGLFEQLRKNKDKEDEEHLELQRSLMRGTLALDEDDAAHLEYLNRKKTEQQSKLQEQTQSEVAAFRAAQMEQKLGGDDKSKQYAKEKEPISLVKTTNSEETPSFTAPIIKKRKRKAETAEKTNQSTNQPKEAKPDTANETSSSNKATAGISTLLAGYDSSSSEED